MKTPESFRTAFKRERQIGERLEETAGGQLRRLCKTNKWLFDGRVKGYESALAKLQQGQLASLNDMVDLYAATVVVPTRDQIPSAIEAVRAQFHTAEIRSPKPATLKSARTFMYDDVHIYASLGTTAPGLNPAIRDRRFEIQVRTGLQFSWWRATHDQVYKGPSSSWRLERTANQVRGSIELLDGVLADLPKAARMLDERKTPQDAEFSQVVGWLSRWAPKQRPEDHRRFVLTVQSWLKQVGMTLQEVDTLLGTKRACELIADEEITPAQVIQILAAEEKGADALVSGDLVLLRTDELSAISPDLARVDDGKCVQLG